MKNPVITAIFDYVIELSGKYNYKQNQIFKLKNKDLEVHMLLISATGDKAYCLASKGLGEIIVGQEVSELKASNLAKTPLDVYGKIIDINSQVLFPQDATLGSESYQVEHEIFNSNNKLLDFRPLSEQLYTGYINIDLLIPIGKGQRELIIGDRKTGKTFIALNTIINQKGKNVKCIYVSIGQQKEQVSAAYKILKDNGALDYTFIIDASSSSPYEQYLAPYVAMAHAENISMTDDVLIIFDSLTNHANVVREIALLINKPVGKEAFPGDMFYTHSKLLERSGKFLGRKSITALPIIQTIENDITSLIASNVISITDGQIVTNSDLFASGKIPAVDIQLSVSRIGGNVQKPYIAKVASEIGKLYKSYKRQINLASLKYDLNDSLKTLLSNGAIAESMFIQKGVSSYSEEVMFLTSKLVTWGILNGISDIQLALKFIDLFIHHDKLAFQIFQNLLANKQKSDELARNFFKFALFEFAKANNLNWNIELNSKEEFTPIDHELISKISKLLVEVK
ncbi:MSC_0619 family F1-like ATPase alpha subunit [Mycoplasmopsis gallopavonis]|uniref:ATP synthase F1 subunit alpha n=1 Tax=Mycoplasmopsis gallopavonis TaxID=76629 RepID=A0A449B0D6_9BACT|nr:ATP F0F1 synthase subunit alpha [Mycoplasmopsis gallopavonis]RIV16451.1 ATP F0F1 synthase subunit alpha [Mycoplasmopsis gallopavonis]VEU73230.1 ATP synthase F1 subunit alpha [Mycoplasmopsis gallopavonis]